MTAYVTFSISPVVLFGTYIDFSHAHTFDTSRLFASLILVSLLATPLVRLLQIIPQYGAAFACVRRLEAFLNTPEPAKSAQEFEESASLKQGLDSASNAYEKSGRSACCDEQYIVKIREADVCIGSETLLPRTTSTLLEAGTLQSLEQWGAGNLSCCDWCWERSSHTKDLSMWKNHKLLDTAPRLRGLRTSLSRRPSFSAPLVISTGTKESWMHVLSTHC